MALGAQMLSGPPPSPQLDPAAAAAQATPPNPMRTLAGPAGGVGQSPGGAPAGPDQSGLLQLGQKLQEGLLTLAQAAPDISDDMNQCVGILQNALAKVLESQAGTGTAGKGPIGGPPAPVVTQSGVQNPGGGFGAGKPF